MARRTLRLISPPPERVDTSITASDLERCDPLPSPLPPRTTTRWPGGARAAAVNAPRGVRGGRRRGGGGRPGPRAPAAGGRGAGPARWGPALGGHDADTDEREQAGRDRHALTAGNLRGAGLHYRHHCLAC